VINSLGHHAQAELHSVHMRCSNCCCTNCQVAAAADIPAINSFGALLMLILMSQQTLQQALLSHSTKRHCSENHMFIASVRAYKSKLAAGDSAGADAQRAMIVEKFINAGELQVNLSSWTVQHTLMCAASSDAHCFDAAADEICKLMSTDIWHKFTRSVEYLSLTAEERNSGYSTALVEHEHEHSDAVPVAAAAAAAAATTTAATEAVSSDCSSDVHTQQQHEHQHQQQQQEQQRQTEMSPAHSCSPAAADLEEDDGYSSSTSSTVSNSSMGTLMSSNDSRAHVYSGDASPPPRLSILTSASFHGSGMYACCETE
jgi:Regulator of G protein signaling domain